MPLTAKGSSILAAMQKTYGAEKGESVFYASRNAGKITGVDAKDMSGEEWDRLSALFGEWIKEERREPEHASDRQMVDFGPKSGRKYDEQNGFLHVRCHISKACVNPYRGAEIPGADKLGLDPDKIYNLFRDPKELEAGASTFHNVPLMSNHPEGGVTSADEHLVKVGSIADPKFEHPYLDADVVVWNDSQIAGIETDTQRELSSSYGYVPVMEPGEFEGTKYDGRMTAIHANHVALVSAGRAGSDVIVGDAALDILEPGDFLMALKPRVSARSVLARGAIVATIRPLLAADAKLDMAPIAAALDKITGKNWLQQKPRLATAIMGALRKTKLAADAEEAEEKVNEALDSLDDEEAKDEEVKEEEKAKDRRAKDEDETEEEKKARDVKRAKDGVALDEDETEEEREERMAARDKKAKDDEEEEKEKEKATDKAKDKRAMDAAIAAAEKRAEDRTIARLRSIREAETDVLPHVGAVVAMDSAEEIYRFALDQAGVENAHIHEVPALRAMVSMLPKPGEMPDTTGGDRFAQDTAPGSTDAWLKKFGVGA